MQQDTLEFPVIECVEGGVTDDGQSMLLKLSTVEHGSIRFCLRHCDLEAFVTFLLRMAANSAGSAPKDDRVRYQPIPVSGISAGELADGMGCLGVTIGGTELMFQMPAAAISKVAQTLLLVGDPDDHRILS
jgi:hypothetical protein